MKKIYFLLVFFSLSMYSFSVNTIVYVDQNNVAASDANVGTDPANPWLTLNPTKWTDNMTVYIANGTYTISAKITLGATNIEFIGASRSGVILESMNDATFAASTTGNTLFQLSGKTALFRSMTIKNVRDNTLKLGGAFDLLSSSSLTVKDVTFKKLISAQSSWSGGGAIMVRGATLNVDSCTFDSCQSNIGGAIMLYTSSSITDNTVNISNTNFTNNSNPYEAFFTNSHFGGAITFSGKGTLNINKCYFEGNTSKLNTSNSGYGTGGAIVVRLDAGATSSLNISNSVFYKNESDGAGSVMAIGNNGVNTSTVFNLNMSNNVLYQNKGNVYSGTTPNTLALYSTGVMYTGTFIFANNTFFQNYNADRANSPSISLESMPVSAYFINNLMNDNQVTGVTVYGLSRSAISNSATLRRFKGNVFNHLGGGLSVSDATNYPDLFESNSNSTNGNRSWISNTYQKINESLTVPSTGMPYLEVQSGGIGVNFGVDEFLVNSVNVVPAVDIRGLSRNGTTDAGAFELDGGGGITTAIEQFIGNQVNKFIYHSGSQQVMLNKAYETVQVYNVNGSCLVHIKNSSLINVSGLSNGLYIIKISDNGKTTNYKFLKQ